MAGLESYERVYGGRWVDTQDARYHFQQKYHGHDVIHPLDISTPHPLAEDSPPRDDGQSFFYIHSYRL